MADKLETEKKERNDFSDLTWNESFAIWLSSFLIALSSVAFTDDLTPNGAGKLAAFIIVALGLLISLHFHLKRMATQKIIEAIRENSQRK